MNQLDVLIVGGGPAGMSAAIELAACGVQCSIVDEGFGLGGQIYRQALVTTKGLDAAESTRGDVLRQQVAGYADRINVRVGASVWGIFDDKSGNYGRTGRGNHKSADNHPRHRSV